MYINKINYQPNLNNQKMSSYINIFLKTEITCIPKLLSNFFGGYYNNALCNGATWVFALWCIVHAIFDKCMDAFLTKLRYREYVRLRLKKGLWYLGFYGTSFVYCTAILSQNEVKFFNFKRIHIPSRGSSQNTSPSDLPSNLPMPMILGYILISTFYLHSAVWEGLAKGSLRRMLNYSLLFVFMLLSYISGIVEVFEISLKLTISVSLAQVTLEFTRCCIMSTVQESFIFKLLVAGYYLMTFTIYVLVHLMVIPLVCIIPLGLSIMSDNPNILLLFLFFIILAWLGTEIYQSILFKFGNHWLYHKNDAEKSDSSTETLNEIESLYRCKTTLLECSLFKPRDDVPYNLRMLRNEIQHRKTKMMAMRKPKNVFFQTLKCMVAIKRKLSERRRSDASDSDDSDKSENVDLTSNENPDNAVLEAQSDHESDDEVSESQENIDTQIIEPKDDAVETKGTSTLVDNEDNSSNESDDNNNESDKENMSTQEINDSEKELIQPGLSRNVALESNEKSSLLLLGDGNQSLENQEKLNEQ